MTNSRSLDKLIRERIEEYRHRMLEGQDDYKLASRVINELELVRLNLGKAIDELADKSTAGGDVQFSQVVRILGEDYE